MIRWSVVPVGVPVGLPVSLDEAKAHLRVTHDEEDEYITLLIQAAADDASMFLGRALTPRMLRLTLERFPSGNGVIYLPLPPVRQVVEVYYTDTTGAKHVLPPEWYVTDLAMAPARIAPAPGRSWPIGGLQPLTGLTIEYTAGYDHIPGTELESMTMTRTVGFYEATGGNEALYIVPAAVKQAILLMVGHLYENREAVSAERTPVELPMGVKHLLMKHRVFVPEVR